MQMQTHISRVVLVLVMVLLFSGATITLAQKKEDAPKKVAVTGTIEFKGDAKFEAETVANVTIRDVSIADAPAPIIGQQLIKDLKKFPISFEVEYDPAKIDQRLMYSVGVRIETKGRLDYINDTAILIISRNNPISDVKVPVIQVKR